MIVNNNVQTIFTKNTYIAKQLLSQITIEKHPKSIFSNVYSCYFEADDVKKHTHENIMPDIYRGVFHNYVHVCKQLFCMM